MSTGGDGESAERTRMGGKPIGREMLEEIAQAEEWRAYKAMRTPFDFPGNEVAYEIQQRLGWHAREVRDITNETYWGQLGWTPRKDAIGLEIGGERYYRKKEMAPGPDARDIEMPEPAWPQGEVREADIERLATVLAQNRWTLLWEPGPGGWPGETVYGEMKVYVPRAETPLATLCALAHEVGHAWMHLGSPPGAKWEWEVEAQSFAWDLLSSWGYDISAYSAAYILKWSRGEPRRDLVFSECVERGLRLLRQELDMGMEVEGRQVAGMP